MSTWFDEQYYLTVKLAQLHAINETDLNGQQYTMKTLLDALDRAGLTPEEHYLQYGRDEGLNPNAYFNEQEYLIAKTAQVNDIRQDGRADWTVEQVATAIKNINMTPLQHYERYGTQETFTNGSLINPSNAFDANAYASAKLYQLEQYGTAQEKSTWAEKNGAELAQYIEEQGMSMVITICCMAPRKPKQMMC